MSTTDLCICPNHMLIFWWLCMLTSPTWMPEPPDYNIALASLSQATIHNVTMLSKKLSQAEFDNNKLKEEVIILKEEIHKWRKVDDETTPLWVTILYQHAKLYDVRMECISTQKIKHELKFIHSIFQKFCSNKGFLTGMLQIVSDVLIWWKSPK